ncbi:MAG: NnrU family protein [Burkholderiales bacterium]|nr:NnrU family protein [Burkholderiales bacterium]
MTLLIVGLILFVGTHSVRIFADDWRRRAIARVGALAWKGGYSLVSLAGFVLLVWGYGEARGVPVLLYDPPRVLYHLASLLTLVAFVFVAAAYVPANHIKAAIGHPMAAGVKVWAFAHLLANGRLADVILFGAFLAWAIADFAAARRRDRATGTRHPAGRAVGTATAVIAGTAVWAAFAFWAHLWLIGVAPIPR